jgi:hypothetical protein
MIGGTGRPADAAPRATAGRATAPRWAVGTCHDIAASATAPAISTIRGPSAARAATADTVIVPPVAGAAADERALAAAARAVRRAAARSGRRCARATTSEHRARRPAGPVPGYSTVTLLARLRGLSTSRPSTTAAW